MSAYCKWSLLALTGLAAAVRFHALFANTFHADEALFAGWARLIAVWRDPLLLTQPVDKPPLLFYLQAWFYPLLGPVEWAARLPDFVASLLLVPLAGGLAWRLYRDEWGTIVAAALVALSPLAIQFSATAFTDPLLVAFLTVSLTMASRKWTCNLQLVTCNPTLSGVFFGLAAATKHQAWLFLPLLGSMAVLAGWRWRQWRRWLAGFVPILLLLFLWEVARSGGPALWPAQMANFGGVRPIWSWELWPRFNAWLVFWQYVVPWPALAIGFPAAIVTLARAWREPGRAAALNLLLVLYSFNYFLLHWLLAVPVWDRYLLPLVPIVALIIGFGFSRLLAVVKKNQENMHKGYRGAGFLRLLAGALLLLALALEAWQARSGRFPIGSQPAADKGAAQVAAALIDAPYGTVLYDHWYSWQWRYHLFDRRVYVSWFPYPAALARELAVFGNDGNGHYVALPNSGAALPVRRAIDAAGFQLQPIPINGQTEIELYQIMPVPGQGDRLTR